MRNIFFILGLLAVAQFGIEGTINKTVESVCTVAMAAETLNESGTGGHGKICKNLEIIKE